MLGERQRRGAADGSRKGERLRTVAEQIADHLAVAIVNGEYRGGERLREVEVASLYAVSRAPVREAIRDLGRRGLVRFVPRRGAHVIELSLDTIADVFNMRAVLMGLAVRMIASRHEPSALREMKGRIDLLDEIVDDDDPVRFARYTGRIGAAIVDLCRSEPLSDLLKVQVRHSVWGILWREKPLDFHTRTRRRGAVREWRDLLAALEAGDEHAAERLQRRIHFNSRDNALASIGRSRLRAPSADRRLHDRGPDMAS